MVVARHGDEPWRRLPVLVPLAVVIALLSLMGFLHLLAQAPTPPQAPRPLEVGVVELATPTPPIPAAAVPVPEPKVEEPPPEPPPPEPQAALPPEPPPPPPPRKPPAPPRPSPLPRQALPVAQPAAPNRVATPEPPAAPPEASPQPPGGGTAGARVIFQPMPQIPDELRRHRIDAVAVVRFSVAPDGSAMVELRQATDDPRLNQVLLEGFKRWRFFPALAHDQPVASILELRVPIQVH